MSLRAASSGPRSRRAAVFSFGPGRAAHGRKIVTEKVCSVMVRARHDARPGVGVLLAHCEAWVKGERGSSATS